MTEKHHIAEINSEAGDHAMPQDPHEIALALRAAKVAWHKYPYLEHRYGERGRRFTDSDSCWLLTLARAPREVAVTRALEWLRTILASRGIPTIVLEFHLEAILGTISEEMPDRPAMQNQFDRFLSDREAERGKLLDAENRLRLIDAFGLRFRACAGLKIESAADLIVSAWVDQHSGIPGALPALRDWLTDAQRFSANWIAHVAELLVELDAAHGQST